MAHLSGPAMYPQQTSEATSYSSLTVSKIQLGTRARDMAGNEYVYVDFDAAKQKGEVVGYDPSTFLTADLAATYGGPVGVVVSYASSSDLAGWHQIYGRCEQVLASVAHLGWRRSSGYHRRLLRRDQCDDGRGRSGGGHVPDLGPEQFGYHQLV